tara:strand:+ start:112 stop:771 length:660 start_codon:yes stop_codon:yes gene_type:complete
MQKQLYYRGEKDAKKVRSWKKKLQETCKRCKSFDLLQSALVVVDMQHYFLDAGSHAFVPSSPAILPNVSKLIQLFRDAGRPVIFTYFAVEKHEQDPIGEWWGRTVYEGTTESRIVEEIAPEKDDLVIRKPSYSSFHGTELDSFLREQGSHSLLVTGVLTNLCCDTTAREAFSHGFDVFIAMDATASFNEEMHLSSLINLSYGFATPLSTEDILTSSSDS